MIGTRKDIYNWLLEHGEEQTFPTAISFFAREGLLDDCVVEKQKGLRGAWKFDVEKAGKRILWIREKQRVARFTLKEIKDMLNQKQKP